MSRRLERYLTDKTWTLIRLFDIIWTQKSSMPLHFVGVQITFIKPLKYACIILHMHSQAYILFVL